MRRVLVGVVLAALLPAAPAWAQLERSGAAPHVGVLQPGASLTPGADAGALDINPAQTGWLDAWSVLLVHTELANNARYVGTGTGAFFGAKIPLLPLALSPGAQVLRPGDGFGERYPAFGKLSLGLAWRPYPWLSVGLGGHLFVAPDSGLSTGLATLDMGATFRPASWLSLAVVARDLTNPNWAGLPLQRRYQVEVGLRPLANGRFGLGLGFEVGSAGETSPRAVLQGEPWPGFTLFADATWLRRDVDATDGVERRSDDVRFTVGVRLDWERVGIRAGFVGGAPGLTGGAVGGGSFAIRISGDRHRSVSQQSSRILLVDLGKRMDTRSHLYRLSVLHAAARDRGVKAVLIKIGSGLGWSGAEEVRRAIATLRRKGIKVVVYLYASTAQGYHMALAADRILLFPGGGLRFAGLVSTRLYFKRALDKLGIRAQIYKYEAFKSAPETFTREGPTPEANKVRDALLDDFASRLYAAMATRKKIPSVAAAKKVLAQGPFTAAEALELGLVDALVYPDKVPLDVQKYVGRMLPLERPPTRAKRNDDWGLSPVVAVVAVEGDIVEGKSQTLPILGRKMAGAQTLIKLLGALAAAPRVRAVVLRVDSGGGSALGSEALWRAVRQLAKDKPVIASLGNVAASGGYFAAVGARTIYAEPSTVTGSIGIFAGKADLSGLLAKVGVTVDTKKLRGGSRADVESSYRPYTEPELAALKKKLRYYYLRFVDAVAKGRKKLGKRSRALPLAGGRVWSGKQALDRGLVDHLGGLYEAVTAARKLAKLRPGDGHRVVVLPRRRGGILVRLVKLFLGGARSKTAFSPLLRKVLAPLTRIPPSMLVGKPSAPQARLPYDITIR